MEGAEQTRIGLKRTEIGLKFLNPSARPNQKATYFPESEQDVLEFELEFEFEFEFELERPPGSCSAAHGR